MNHKQINVDLIYKTLVSDFLRREYGGLDVLVNNAGIGFKNTDPTPFPIQAEVTMKTNFFSTRNICTELLPLMKPHGRVVNVSSMMSVMSLKSCSPELQQKFRSDTITEEELVALMNKIQARNLSAQRKGDKILLNACCPGWVRTDMTGPNATKNPEEGAETQVPFCPQMWKGLTDSLLVRKRLSSGELIL
ncbi:PREDICTED: carbonyl reductase [NADPH] 1-like [Elephantulus edwardii]|uniref:carbonyl reductase [NADPH] 1-like n=1 Tax=Elephantulus edwardii TaxID=28737 RepID=UPI0003F080E0|nr:PREDICTED: carbonyl reductase [NADPH] 1-like [Elephantulus edwardii]